MLLHINLVDPGTGASGYVPNRSSTSATSTGINVAGEIRLAHKMEPGHTIVTVLADGGSRYTSRLFNPEFLRSKNLPVPTPLIPVP